MIFSCRRQIFPLLALAVSAGCQPGSTSTGSDVPDVDIQVSTNAYNGTVVTLSWAADVCPGASPDVILDPADGEALPGDDGAPQVVLLGMAPSTLHDFTVDLVVDGETCARGVGQFTTESGADGAMDLSLSADDGSTRGWLMTSQVIPPSGPALVDTSGNVVWFWPEETSSSVTRAILSNDRRSVIYGAWMFDSDRQGYLVNDLVRVSIDGTKVERHETLGMHHDLLEREDGTIAYIGSRTAMADDGTGPYMVDQLVELTPDGVDRVLFDATMLFPMDAAHAPQPDDGMTEQQWTHANAIHYSAEEDAYYLSFRWRNSIVKIDAGSGEVLWVFGGDESTFTLQEGTWPESQHQFRVLGDRLLVFDNGSMDTLDSRVVEYSLDEAAGTARELWEYHRDPPVYEYVLGDVDRLANGNVMVAWCAFGAVEVVTPDKQAVWRTNTNIGGAFGYVQWLEDLAPSNL